MRIVKILSTAECYGCNLGYILKSFRDCVKERLNIVSKYHKVTMLMGEVHYLIWEPFM